MSEPAPWNPARFTHENSDPRTSAPVVAIDVVDVAQARQEFERALRDGGGCCPVCKREGKAYRRGINRVQAAALLVAGRELAWQGQTIGEVDLPELLSNNPTLARKVGGDYGRLRHWGLLRHVKGGLWDVTRRAAAWMAGDLEIPRYVVEFAGRVLVEPHGEPISFADALQVPAETSWQMIDASRLTDTREEYQATIFDIAS